MVDRFLDTGVRLRRIHSERDEKTFGVFGGLHDPVGQGNRAALVAFSYDEIRDFLFFPVTLDPATRSR